MKDGCNFLPVGGWLKTSSRACNHQDEPPAAIVANNKKTRVIKAIF
jgi:hypothetical protein